MPKRAPRTPRTPRPSPVSIASSLRHPARRRGPKPRARTEAEAAMYEVESKTSTARRRISGKDRLFLRLYAESGFIDPTKPALQAGFRAPGAGWKLVQRLQPLIEAEQVRAAAGKAMSVEEALQLCADRARSSSDEKVQHAYLQLYMRAQGMLSDKPMPNTMRRAMQAQIAAVVDRVQSGLKKGQRAKLKAMLGTAVGVEVEVEGTREGEGAGETPSPSRTDDVQDAVDAELLTSGDPDADASSDREQEP